MEDMKPIFKPKDMITDDIKPILIQRALSLVSSVGDDMLGDAVDTFS